MDEVLKKLHNRLYTYIHYLRTMSPNNPELFKEKNSRSKGEGSAIKIRPSDRETLAQGNCHENSEFASLGFGGENEQKEAIDKYCTGCPVKGACLNYALENPQESHGGSGVWGGTLPRQRNLHRKSILTGELKPVDLHWFPKSPDESDSSPS